MAPLRGERYRCTSCEDFDLCETCHEARADIHNTSHTFRLVPVSGVRHRGWRHRGTSAASEMIEGPLSASRLDLLLSAAGEDLFEPLGTFGDLGAIASSGRSARNSRLARRERRQQQQRRLRGGAGTNIVTFNAADPSRVFQHMARGNFEQPSPLQIGSSSSCSAIRSTASRPPTRANARCKRTAPTGVTRTVQSTAGSCLASHRTA